MKLSSCIPSVPSEEMELYRGLANKVSESEATLTQVGQQGWNPLVKFYIKSIFIRLTYYYLFYTIRIT